MGGVKVILRIRPWARGREGEQGLGTFKSSSSLILSSEASSPPSCSISSDVIIQLRRWRHDHVVDESTASYEDLSK